MENILYYQNKIREFEKKLNPDLSYNEINHMLINLCMDIPLPVSTVKWDQRNTLYRARILDTTNIQKLSNWNKDCFWEAPQTAIKNYGRLNNVGESIFYLSNDPFQTLHEINFNNMKPVVLSKYNVNSSFNSTFIGKEYSYKDKQDNDMELVAIQNLFIDFFRNQFSKPVGIGTEYLYRLSNSIAKNFFDLPPEISNSWVYPAVENSNNLNVAFRNGIASEYLVYKGSVIITKMLNNNSMIIPAYYDELYHLHIDNSDDKWIEKNFDFNFRPYKN